MFDNVKRKLMNLFWSGGWDSTFRLLYLLWTDPSAKITAIYVKPSNHKREAREVKAIDDILAGLEHEKRERVTFQHINVPRKTFPYQFYCADVSETIKYQNSVFSNKYRLVPHLDTFIHVARELETKIEYGLEFPPIAKPGTHISIQKYISRETGELDPECPEEWKPLLSLKFPLAYTTKQNMHDLAQDLGFLSLLNLSWFCDAGEEKPCRKCLSCQEVEEANLLYRFQ